MSGLFDYLDWRGDIPFSWVPFSSVDNLILAELAYTDFDGVVPESGVAVTIREVRDRYFELHTREEILARTNFSGQAPMLLDRLAVSKRFESLCLSDYLNVVDTDRDEQIAAVTYRIGDGMYYAAFRGTDNTFDLALSDSGFFRIEFQDKNGNVSEKYTRDGSFTLTKEGVLVTKDGDYVLNTENGRIKVDPLHEVTVDTQGNIFQQGVALTTIKITDFSDYNYLEHYGENYYEPVDGATQIPGDYTINQGYLETSNVQVVQEMVEMISVSRQYESNQRMITTIDSTLEIASKQLGKV